MTLRRRLAIWYGAVLAIVLTASLGLAYALHTEAHDADVDAALADMISRAHTEVEAQLASGAPLAAVDLATLNRAIDEPNAAWLVVDGKVVASAGMTSDLAFTDAAVTELSDGWYTLWTVDGRVRAYAQSLGFGQLVTAADLSVIDAANADLRMAYVVLVLLGVGVGTAIAASIASSALRPVAQLTEAASEIAASRDFHKRVRIAGDPEDELVNLASTFDDMLSSLDDAYRQQQRFLGDVSHELRTPLTTIRGHAELLANGDLSLEAQHDAVARIARESARLARLVDELLVLARAEAAETFAPRPVALDEVVMETFDELRPLSDGRLRVRWIEPAIVSGERDRLKQLVLALVDNALRYTPPPGHVDVSLSDDGHDAVLRVEDEGIGIDPVDRPKVFERFYRGQAARRVNGSGSGLGLAIVRWIVERHGGAIVLDTPDGGRGTLVTVRLPVSAHVAVPHETLLAGAQPVHA